MFGRFFTAHWGEHTRGRPVPWLAIKLGNGVQQGGYESFRGAAPLPTLEQAGGLSGKCWSWHSVAIFGEDLCALWAL